MISLETPQWKRASSRLQGRTSWICSSCVRCSRVTTETSGTRSGDLRKGQSPCEVLGGLSGFLSRLCRGLRLCGESGPEPEDSSPVLTWILAYFWSLPSLRQSSARVGACTCAFLPSYSSGVTLPFRGSRDLWLSLEAFPQGCHTCHRGVSRFSASQSMHCRKIRFL